MIAITLELDKENHGFFIMTEDQERVGEMVVRKKDNVLTVYHTEVQEKAKGKGFGQKLFDNMVDYVTREGLLVRTICPFVYSKFEKDPERYNSIWLKTK